jgi:MFS transporter, ACDE family, multidrug resistance protein
VSQEPIPEPHLQPDARTAAGARPPLWIIFTITATGITGNTLITASLPEIVRGVGGTTGQVGLLLGAATFPGIFLAPVIGLLADRYGRRQILVPCLALFAVTGGLAAAAGSMTVLVILRFLHGVGAAGLVNLAVVTIGDHWSGQERAALIGRNSAVLTTCLAVFPFIGGALTDLGGWRAPFLVYPLALVTAVAAWRRLPAVKPQQVSLADQLRDIGPVLRTSRMVGTMVIGAVAFALIFGLLLTVMPVHLEEAFGVSPTMRGVLLGLPALSNTFIALASGRLQVFGKRRLLAAGVALFAVSLAGAAVSPGLALLITALVVFGAGEGLLLPNLQDIAAGSSSPRTRGGVVALFVSAARVGQTVGPPVAAWGFVAFGAAWMFAGGAAVSALLLVPLLALSPRR